MTTASKDEIIALEKDYWDAMKRKDGKRTSQLSAGDAKGAEAYWGGREESDRRRRCRGLSRRDGGLVP